MNLSSVAGVHPLACHQNVGKDRAVADVMVTDEGHQSSTRSPDGMTITKNFLEYN